MEFVYGFIMLLLFLIAVIILLIGKKKSYFRRFVVVAVIVVIEGGLYTAFNSELLDKSISSINDNELVTVGYNSGRDGDTFVAFKGDRPMVVRLLLVDTPESVKQGVKPQPLSKEASQYTDIRLRNADKIQLDFDETGHRGDKYDRKLAYVYVDGVDLNEELVRKGYARVSYVYEPNKKNIAKYKKAEAAAKKEKLGIWEKEGYVTDKGFNEAVYK